MPKANKNQIEDRRVQGWSRVDNAFLDQVAPKIGCQAVAVYVALNRYAGNKRTCFPAIQTIAQLLNISTRQVIREIQKLEKYKVISIDKSAGVSNLYCLLNQRYWKPVNTSDSQSPVTHSHGRCDSQSRVPVTHSHTKKTQGKKTQVRSITKTVVLVRTAKKTAKPRTFSNDIYNRIIAEYVRLTGVKLQGSEYNRPRRAIKSMLLSNRGEEEIKACMRWFAASEEEWTRHWTMETIEKKIPEFSGGRLTANGSGKEVPGYVDVDGDKIHYTELKKLEQNGKIFYKAGDHKTKGRWHKVR